MKEEKRRIMCHRDCAGFEVFEAPMSLEEYTWDFVGRFAGTHVNTFVLHMIYNTQSPTLKAEEYVSETGRPVGLEGDHATWSAEGKLTANSWRNLKNRKVFTNLGIDPVIVLIEAAHKVGIDFFAGIRMNDVHHAQWEWHPKFWIEHPEFRIGDHPEYRNPRPGFWESGGTFKSQIDSRVPAALDYMHNEVRAYKLAQIEEVARVYEVEGIELDFTRHPYFFKPSEVDMGRDKMTEFVATVRKRLNHIAKERGCPIILEVKVPPTLESCRRIGLDVPRWITHRSVDIVSVASLWHPDYGMPVEEFLDVAKGTDCKIIACIETAEMPILKNALDTAKTIRAAALAYWKAGVDGIYLFNMHFPPHYFRQETPYIKEIGDPGLLEHVDKHYIVTRASNYDDVAWFSYSKQIPVALNEASSATGQKVQIKVGDDIEKAIHLGINTDVTLRLRVMNLTFKDSLEFKFNGIRLSEDRCKSTFFPTGESGGVHQYSFMAEAYYGFPGPYHWLEFKMDKEILPRLGINEVEVILKEKNPEVTDDLILNDVELIIEYRK